MKKLILFALLLGFGLNSFAHNDEQEVWINKTMFDGIKFDYQYIAYDIATKPDDRVQVNCIYSQKGAGLILKSLEIKILMSNAVKAVGTNFTVNGSFPVQPEITKCLQQAGLNKDIKTPVPVSIILPGISIPVQQ